MSDKFTNSVRQIFSEAGVEIGGSAPWDVSVRDERFYGRLLRDGSLGLGESYMDGWWESGQLDETIARLLRSGAHRKARKNLRLCLYFLSAALLNKARRSRAGEVGRRHYDLGNDLYRAMLDKRMIYTCAYWRGAKDLDKAQENKLDLVCRKIGLRRGMKVLDIGGGWGGFAKYAAEKYGASVLATTVSGEQAKLGRELCRGLPVEIRVEDYRSTRGEFDRVVSLGMFEHLGRKNYRRFFKIVRKCLKPDGLFLLHTIGGNVSTVAANLWTNKYIFPNGMLPSIKQIGKAMEKLFVMEDWHNFGTDYDRTLLAWHRNFERNWPEFTARYGERFRRMWRYYLLSSAGAFRARYIQLWQIVLSPQGLPGGYKSIR